jgi:hypothetical protein
MILEKEIVKLKKNNKLLKKERNMYKKAYHELECYFDSISDEEQEKVAKRLERIFKIKLK